MSAPSAIFALEQQKHLMARWFEEVWNQGRREVIFELLDPGCVLYDCDTPIRGPQEFAAFYDNLQSQFSDFRITPHIALAEGEFASLRWSVRCRHKASGRDVSLSGISIVRIRNGRFVEGWQNWDAAGVAAQLV